MKNNFSNSIWTSLYKFFLFFVYMITVSWTFILHFSFQLIDHTNTCIFYTRNNFVIIILSLWSLHFTFQFTPFLYFLMTIFDDLHQLWTFEFLIWIHPWHPLDITILLIWSGYAGHICHVDNRDTNQLMKSDLLIFFA